MSPKTLLSGALLLGALTIATSSSAWACGCGGWSPDIAPQDVGPGVRVTLDNYYTTSDDVAQAGYRGARSVSWQCFKGGVTAVTYNAVEFPTARRAQAEFLRYRPWAPRIHGHDAAGVRLGMSWAVGTRGRYFFLVEAVGPQARPYVQALARYSDQLYTMVTAEAPR